MGLEEGDEIFLLKKTIKKWETAFKETHDSRPSHDDIHNAPQRIRDAYQKYQTLKKSKSLDDKTHDQKKGEESKTSTTETSKKSEKTSPECADNKTNLDFWGSHLNKSTSSEKDGQGVKQRLPQEERAAVLGSISQKLRRNSALLTSGSPIYHRGKENSKVKESSSKSTSKTKGETSRSQFQKVKAADITEDKNKSNDDCDFSFDVFSGQKLTLKNSKRPSVSATSDGFSPFVRHLSRTKTSRAVKSDWLEDCDSSLAEENDSKKEDDDCFKPRKDLSSDSSSKDIQEEKKKELKEAEPPPGDFIEYLKNKRLNESRLSIPKKSVCPRNANPSSFSGKTFPCGRQTQFSKSSVVKPKVQIEERETVSSSKEKYCNEVMPENTKEIENMSDDICLQNLGSTEKNDSCVQNMSFEKNTESLSVQSLNSRKRKDFNLPAAEEMCRSAKRLKSSGREDSISTREETDAVTSEEETANTPVLRAEDVDNKEEEESGKNSKIKASKYKAKARSIRSTGSQPTKNLNENFVRLNMKLKSYVRKGRKMKGEAYKRHVWKQKFGKGNGGGRGRGGSFRNFNHGEDTCFKCGQKGHWASQCTGANFAAKKKLEPEDLPPDQDERMEFPSLEDAAMKAAGVKPEAGKEGTFDLESIPPPVYEAPAPPAPMEPYYPPGPDRKPIDPPKELFVALNKLGFDSFRDGQLETVMNILSGISTLLILSTGSGKSLCYQLPAYLYSQRSACTTLVISPLVSLMEDQIVGLPKCLNGARLHSHMSKVQKEKVVAQIIEGKVNVLLVSPEALVAGGGGLLPHPSKMPPIAFACIDEAHCLSEWSHNFRPSYLMLCKVLREKFGVQCILGLTATATVSTAKDVAEHFEISGLSGSVVRGPSMPRNLVLCASRDLNKDKAIVDLLQSGKMSNLDSVIVYCIRREQTERVSSLLRTCLQEWLHTSEDHAEDKPFVEGEPEEEVTAGKGKKKKDGKKKKGSKRGKGKAEKRPPANSVEAYHAGMNKTERRRVQNMFMSGHLRIVVATVAFGMGLDKQDVRGVIHYSLPRSFESYVQEVGRSGRDRKLAICHLFLDSTGNDLSELRKHIFSNSVDRFTIKKLVKRIFRPCKCHKIRRLQEEDHPDTDNKRCPGHEHALIIESSVQDLDMKEEGIATLMCYLELHNKKWLRSLPATWATCTIHCYGGPKELMRVAHKSPVIAAAIAKERSKGKSFEHDSSVTFDVVEVASSMGWNLWPVKKELKQLQWEQQLGKGWVKTSILVEFSDLSFHFFSPGDLSDEELDEVVTFLTDRVKNQETREVDQLRTIYNSLHSVSEPYHSDCNGMEDSPSSQKLKDILKRYFEGEDRAADDPCLDVPDVWQRIKERTQCPEGTIRGTIRNFISLHHDRSFTGRAIARIFQGIASPIYPAQVWGRDRRFWRIHMDLDFNDLARYATEELLSFR